MQTYVLKYRIDYLFMGFSGKLPFMSHVHYLGLRPRYRQKRVAACIDM